MGARDQASSSPTGGKHIRRTLAATVFRSYEERGLTRVLLPGEQDDVAARRLGEPFGGRDLYAAYEQRLG